MIQGSLARRYARALIALGSEMDLLPQFQEDLKGFGDLLRENENLFRSLCNQTLPLHQRKNALKEILSQLKMNNVCVNFLMLLTDKQRMEAFLDIERQFLELADEHNGLLRTHLQSAKALKDQVTQEIKKELGRITGKTIDLMTEENSELIGGMRTQIGNMIFDGSIDTQLNQLKKQMLHQKIN